jgi:hypothetical protein
MPLGDSILLSLAGLAATTIMLRRYYAGNVRLSARPPNQPAIGPAARPIPAASSEILK